MTRILTYGTFDTLHFGHIRLLGAAKALGDYLVVGLSTDDFNSVKGKVCHQSYEERRELLEAIRYVDLIIPETNWEQKVHDVAEHRIDTFVMGDDWEGKFDELSAHCDVRYLPRTPSISSTSIRNIVQSPT